VGQVEDADEAGRWHGQHQPEHDHQPEPVTPGWGEVFAEEPLHQQDQARQHRRLPRGAPEPVVETAVAKQSGIHAISPFP